PAKRVLEIAPGHGRWTEYLRHLTDALDVVDLSPNCIASCKKRFEAASNIAYYINDGSSLEMIQGQFDFVFSFDSLVHVERDIIEAYVRQIASMLSPNGVAFLHHSNMGQYLRRLRLARRIAGKGFKQLAESLLSINISAGRAESMNAGEFRRICEAAGA